jgi:hypothetical protein
MADQAANVNDAVQQLQRSGRDTFDVIRDVVYLSDVIANTEMVPTGLRGRPDAVCAVILYGHELGLGPMQSLNTINVIGGRPALSPEGMRALVLSAGHAIRVAGDDTAATVQCHRREWATDDWTAHTFTMDDANRAKLTGKADSSWSKYPRAMLIARATSEACRADFSDVIRGLSYTTDEVADMPAVPVPPSGSTHRSDATPKIFVGGIEGTEALETRLLALSFKARTAFKDWRRSRGLVWPPTTTADLMTMTGEVARIEAEGKAEDDAYGTSASGSGAHTTDTRRRRNQPDKSTEPDNGGTENSAPGSVPLYETTPDANPHVDSPAPPTPSLDTPDDGTMNDAEGGADEDT